MSDSAPPTLSAAPRLGLTGRSVYRGTVHTRDWLGLCGRLEDAVRAAYDGFEIRTDEHLGSWFLRARRGLTSGFVVMLIRRPGAAGGADVMVGVSRTSRLDRCGTWVALGAALATFVASCLLVGALGLPGLLAGAVVIAATVVAAVGVYQFLLPAVSLVEYVGGGRFTREQMAAVVELVRETVERPPASANSPALAAS